jgi:hypothetical protein
MSGKQSMASPIDCPEGDAKKLQRISEKWLQRCHWDDLCAGTISPGQNGRPAVPRE